MTQWTKDELKKIARAEELKIASIRRDGTLRKPVTIWVVGHGDSLYVRSVKGPTGGWFRGTQERHEGRIDAAGVKKDVAFVAAGREVEDDVDAAYRAKYRGYAGPVLNSVLTPQARSTTIKLEPRSTAS
jgi:hypothetical protein